MLECPEIISALKTGYPQPPDSLNCENCREEVWQYENMYEWTDENGNVKWVCSECFDELWDELSRDERARLAGVREMTVGGLINRDGEDFI